MIRTLHLVGFITIALVSGAGCASSNHNDREESIPLTSAPAAVQTTAHRVAGENRIEKLKREREDGQLIYEVEFKSAGVDHSASITQSGDIIEEESEAQFSALPPAVQRAVMNKYPQAHVQECAVETRQGKTTYEVQIDVAQHDRELKFDADGNVQSDKLVHEHRHEPHNAEKDRD